MKYDVIALGELLIDFCSYGISEEGNPIYEACPGGAPCNVLSMLSKTGKKTVFIGKVGDDQFGQQLREAILSQGIDDSQLKVDEKVGTTLAFVHKLANGDRDFSFYRNPGADVMLSSDDIDQDLFSKAELFHYGTLSMTHDSSRVATKKAVSYAREAGLMISFDPNIRMSLWDDELVLREQLEYGFQNCDILKISDDEITFFTGIQDYEKAVEYMQENFDIKLLLLTYGKEGSSAYYRNKKYDCPSYKVTPVDATGAGDTYFAGVLSKVLDYGLNHLTDDTIQEALQFASAAASLVTQKKGALKSMPELDEINQLIHQV